MPECIFCEIINKRMKSDLVYEDSELLAFRDINPQAPVHILVVPKQHIGSVKEITEKKVTLAGKMILIAQKIAENEKIDSQGYRIVLNNGVHGGQTVSHLHMHILGGRRMTWPPG
jgi:histidine triad (HIT) family protein